MCWGWDGDVVVVVVGVEGKGVVVVVAVVSPVWVGRRYRQVRGVCYVLLLGGRHFTSLVVWGGGGAGAGLASSFFRALVIRGFLSLLCHASWVVGHGG